MRDITEIDVNFKANDDINREGIKFYDVLEEPFCVYGVKYENGKFRRIPEQVAKSVSLGVYELHANTTGGRVKFITDSPYVAISVKLENICRMSHFALTGSAGFDLYAKEDGKDLFKGTFIPPYDMVDGYDGILEFKDSKFAPPERKLREITVNFPLYTDVKSIYIGLDGESEILPPTPYKYDKPVVYYGHSITQGGCASRPGNSYPAIITRRLNCDHINLGFSGNGMGEDEIAEYIAGLDMQVFVYDYDHNAPDMEHLKNTHERMFKTIRKAHPDLPVIMMTSTTMPIFMDDAEGRRQIIYTTYKNALDSGDKNVYYLDGDKIYNHTDDSSTVEGSHPSDLGFMHIADTVEELLKEILK